MKTGIGGCSEHAEDLHFPPPRLVAVAGEAAPPHAAAATPSPVGGGVPSPVGRWVCSGASPGPQQATDRPTGSWHRCSGVGAPARSAPRPDPPRGAADATRGARLPVPRRAPGARGSSSWRQATLRGPNALTSSRCAAGQGLFPGDLLPWGTITKQRARNVSSPPRPASLSPK